MKNKKLIVSLLVVVLVLSMLAVCLTACDDDKPQEETPSGDPNWDEIESAVLAEKLDLAIENLAPDSALLNNTEIAADLDIDAKYGDSEKSYHIAFAVQLGLDIEDENTNAFSFVVTDKSDNSTAFGAYYDESLSGEWGENIYLVGPNKAIALKGVKVKDVLKDQGAVVNDEWCEGAKNTVLDGISEYFNGYVVETAGGLGITKLSKDGKVGRLELPLSTLLNDTSEGSLGQLLAGSGSTMIQPYIDALGIDLKVAELAKIIPELTVALQFTFEGEDLDTTLTDIQIELACGKKDLVINKVGGGTLIEVDITEEFSATVAATFEVAPAKSKIKWASQAVYNDTKAVNALNASASAELTIDQDLTASFADGKIKLNIPQGTYTVDLAIDADPTVLIGMSFANNGLSDILTIVGNVLEEAVDYLLLDIRSKDAVEGTPSLLKLELARDPLGRLIVAETQLDALFGADSGVNIGGLPIGQAITTIADLFGGGSGEEQPSEPDENPNPSGSTSGSTSGSASGDAAMETINKIKPYVQLISIILKGGALNAGIENLEFEVKDTEGKEVIGKAGMSANVKVDSSGVVITGVANGLNLLASGLPEKLNVTIKITDFSIGDVVARVVED